MNTLEPLDISSGSSAKMLMNNLSEKKLLFIGGGPEQVNTIQWAVEQGVKAYLVDISENALALPYATEHLICDIRDKHRILKFAKKHAIEGVTSICLESTMHTTAYIVDELRLPGLSHKAAENVTNKYRMRTLFERAGLPVPRYKLIAPELLDEEEFPGFAGPWVIKPVDNAGSRGVRMVQERYHLKEAYQDALKFSRRSEVLIEEFIPGKEISVEGYVIKGNLLVETLSDKHRSPLPYLFDLALKFPSAYPDHVQQEAVRQIGEAVKALGIQEGPVHAELMVTSEHKVFIVEIAGRGPGSKVYTEIIPHVSGVHPNRLQVFSALNCMPENIKVSTPLKGATLYFFTSQSRKKIKSFIGLEKLHDIQGVFECRFYLQPGDIVEKCISGEQRYGQLITLGNTLEEAMDVQNKALNLINVELESVD